MTLVELSELAEGFAWRDDHILKLAAWMTSHLMNVSGKTVQGRVTPMRLLGRQVDPAMMSDAQKESMRDEMMKRWGSDDPEKNGVN